MTLLLLVFFFALGAIAASFVGVVVARLFTGQSFLSGRSRCDACNAVLSPFSLLPIVSSLVSRGRATCCGARVTPLMTIAEVLEGVLFVLVYVKLGFTPALPLALLSLSLLLALVLYDLVHQILPPALLIPFVVVSGATGFLSASSTFLNTAIIAFLIALALALIHVVSGGRAMGLADAPFALGCALLTGPAALTGFVFSFWIGAAIGIIVLLQRPVGSRMRVEVPFAPFLAAGFLLAYFTQWNLFALFAGSP